VARRDPFTQRDIEERLRELGQFWEQEPIDFDPKFDNCYRPFWKQGRPEPDPKLEEYLAELAQSAGVPADRIDEFIAALKEEHRRYRVFELASEQERPSRRAEGYQEIADATAKLLQVINKAPIDQRVPLEHVIPPIRRRTRRPAREGESPKEAMGQLKRKGGAEAFATTKYLDSG
jgi:hypothetical protein